VIFPLFVLSAFPEKGSPYSFERFAFVPHHEICSLFTSFCSILVCRTPYPPLHPPLSFGAGCLSPFFAVVRIPGPVLRCVRSLFRSAVPLITPWGPPYFVSEGLVMEALHEPHSLSSAKKRHLLFASLVVPPLPLVVWSPLTKGCLRPPFFRRSGPKDFASRGLLNAFLL